MKEDLHRTHGSGCEGRFEDLHISAIMGGDHDHLLAHVVNVEIAAIAPASYSRRRCQWNRQAPS